MKCKKVIAVRAKYYVDNKTSYGLELCYQIQ